MYKAVRALLIKDVLIEWRNRYVLGGMVLYVFSSVLLIYFSLQYNNSLRSLSPVVWSMLFWLIVLFSSLNAIANSFFREPEGRSYYYYYLTTPQAIILARMCYNFLFTLLLSSLAFLVFTVMIGSPVTHSGLFFITVLLGGTSYSFLFTLMSAIASRAGGNATLIAVLGFPIIIPLLIFITKLSAASIAEGAITPASLQHIGLLSALDVMQLILAYILFPYIWRD
ncbi:MAG: heme exporter protein CcmB [Chitinophagales bacterium]